MKINLQQVPQVNRHIENLQKLTNLGTFDTLDVLENLYRLETKATRLTTALCNGEGDEERHNKQLESIKKKVLALLPALNENDFYLNTDPRGYALKVKENKAKEIDLYRDWGSYGILAPEFN